MTTAVIMKRLQDWALKENLDVDQDYCRDPAQNVPWLNPETRAELIAADGGEFTVKGKGAKIAALHSSSALAVNVFDYWRHRDQGALGPALGFPQAIATSVQFERKFPTGIGPRSPNLDVVLTLQDRSLLAIESKFSEWTGAPGRTPLRQAYFPSGRALWTENGLSGTQRVAETYLTDGFHHLDVPQLLKHMLGLAHSCKQQPWRLLLLWHRCDRELGSRMDNEIGRFVELLGPDRLHFSSMTYQEFWGLLAPSIRLEHADYARYVEDRYFADRDKSHSSTHLDSGASLMMKKEDV
jgi:hypothetical protein